ncbi:MAG: GHMP kinase [Candidatus Aenigmarchaeota archaeon]|nr:GHMP kinase [Candidatus Aenigmarchaeota archaeon]
MAIIKTIAYPRIGLIGNPSDGYFGKTIAFTFGNFSANVKLWESPELEFELSEADEHHFKDLNSFRERIGKLSYYGGIRLEKACLEMLCEYCEKHGIKLDRNFTIRYDTDIPLRKGLAGSSAIITATLLAIKEFYGFDIDEKEQAKLVWETEIKQLKIAGGLQDRVAQAYNKLVYMDFTNKEKVKHGYGEYEVMGDDILKKLMPRLFVAYRTDFGEESAVPHSDLRTRVFIKKEPKVIEAMKRFAEITDRARICLDSENFEGLGLLMDENFDLRTEICSINDRDREMVEIGRRLGAHVKFSGSGGAVVGLYDSAEKKDLKSAYEDASFVFLEKLKELQ